MLASGQCHCACVLATLDESCTGAILTLGTVGTLHWQAVQACNHKFAFDLGVHPLLHAGECPVYTKTILAEPHSCVINNTCGSSSTGVS